MKKILLTLAFIALAFSSAQASSPAMGADAPHVAPAQPADNPATNPAMERFAISYRKQLASVVLLAADLQAKNDAMEFELAALKEQLAKTQAELATANSKLPPAPVAVPSAAPTSASSPAAPGRK